MNFDLKSLIGKDGGKGIAILIIVVVSAILLMSLYKDGGNHDDVSDFEYILSKIDGAGKTNAYITYEDNNNSKSEVKGIIIVSQGAGNLKVKLKLQEAAAAAFAVSVDSVKIYEMKEGE